MRRLRILWLSHLLPYPPKGGALQRSHHLLRRVAAHHDVDLVAFNQRALLPTPESVAGATRALGGFCRIRAVCTIPADRVWRGHLRLLLTSALSRRAYTMRWLEATEMSRALQAIGRNADFDILHVDTISLAPYQRVVTARARVLNHHNIESHMMRRHAERERSRLAALYLRMEAAKIERHERQLCQLFDANLTCSTLDAQRLRAISPHIRTEEVPNGVDLEYFRSTGLPQEPGSLLFVGGMRWYPNRDAMTFFASEIWPRLRERRNDVSMTVVGARPPRSLVALAAGDPRYRVTGFVDDVRPYLERAAVYVCPIRDGGGTKLKVLDALAMGKAIVAHPVAIEGLAVVPGVHVLTASTAEEFTAAVIRLLGDDDLRRRLGEAGRRLVSQRYDFDAIAHRLMEFYGALYEDATLRLRATSAGAADAGPIEVVG